MRTKKGVWLAFSLPFTILMIVGVSLGMAGFMFFISKESAKLSHVPPSFEQSIAEQRLWTDCFGAQNIARNQLGVLDWEKIDQLPLNECFLAGEHYPFAFKIKAAIPSQQAFKQDFITTSNWGKGGPDRTRIVKTKILYNGKPYDAEISLHIKDVT